MSPYQWRASNTQHSRSLSSEGSLACHIYCDRDHPLIMVITEDPRHLHVLNACQRSCLTTFNRLRSVSTRDQTPISHARQRLYHWAIMVNIYICTTHSMISYCWKYICMSKQSFYSPKCPPLVTSRSMRVKFLRENLNNAQSINQANLTWTR